MNPDRRTVLKTTAAAGAASVLPASTVTGGNRPETVDDALDLGGGVQEVLVVFDSNDDVDQLSQFDLPDGYHRFSVLPVGYTRATGDQIERIAALDSVRYVEKNRELDWHNNDAREVTRVSNIRDEEQGSAAHAVVIDTGVDGNHPDLVGNLRNNFRYVNPLSSREDTTWVRASRANTDDNGHGTHTSGTVAGDGSASKDDGDDVNFGGMAPKADLTVYSAGLTLFVVKAVAAYDHMLQEFVARGPDGEIQRDADGRPIRDVQVVSNSYGISSSHEFNPDGALEVATFEAFQAGILPVFSAGNSGPEHDTLNDYVKGPHVLGVAATEDDTSVAGFSSRGRQPHREAGEGANYDRLTALENLEAYHGTNLEQGNTKQLERTGQVGPGVELEAHFGKSVYEELDLTEAADFAASYVEAELSWAPPGQDIDLYLRAESKDGPVVASGATLSNPEELASQVESDRTYYFEINPYVNVAADYTLEITLHEGPSDAPSGPFGIYRNGVGAPGVWVMSTLNPAAPLQSYPGLVAAASASDGELGEAQEGTEKQVEQSDDSYYGRLSGTSMSCPVVAGIATLLNSASRKASGHYPSPFEVAGTIEYWAGNPDERNAYTPANIGAGFVNADRAHTAAKFDALIDREDYEDIQDDPEDSILVELGDESDVFEVVGDRVDESTQYTAGKTYRGEIHVTELSHAVSQVTDFLPEDWTVLDGNHETTYVQDGRKVIEFLKEGGDDTAGPVNEGDDELKYRYFAEIPSDEETGTRQVGPATVTPTENENGYRGDVEAGEPVEIPGTTDTNVIVGVDQTDPGSSTTDSTDSTTDSTDSTTDAASGDDGSTLDSATDAIGNTTDTVSSGE